MNITVINGTPIHGVTYHMKSLFLKQLKGNNQITEFYPNDIPSFCLGCKNFIGVCLSCICTSCASFY